jgi:tRNA-splicing ligase RtcB
MASDNQVPHRLIETGEATAILPVNNGEVSPVTVIANRAIRATLDERTLGQAAVARAAPGVTRVVLNPDAHVGYGAPIGCVMVSPTHIYPGPVGVDIKCSMSLLQFDLPIEELASASLRRALIDAILLRTPTGAGRGQRQAPLARHVSFDLGVRAITRGAAPDVLADLGIPAHWALRCEDSHHLGHDDTASALDTRLDALRGSLIPDRTLAEKIAQFGSYGGGNHFGECEAVHVHQDPRAALIASSFGLRDGCAAFLSHCGSRGLGALLANNQFKSLQKHFATWNIPLPGNDRHMVHAPLGTPEADAYLDDMALGANFATVNHLLINALVLEAFQSVIPGVTGELVYFISHNIARRENVDLSGTGGGKAAPAWVHRKGATRAFPAGHHALKGTPFAESGHPIVLPGDPQRGSAVMVAEPGAALSCYSVNHGAGRMMSRTAATKALDQSEVDASFAARDILTNCRQYPRDEAPAAYKDFAQVLDSITAAGLARMVARLDARFVIKDGDAADD